MNRKISNLKSQVPNGIRLVLDVWFLELPAEQGFTLVETLIAVTILMLAVAGPLYTASRAIVSAETSRDQLTASYLAQEGTEYMRKVRDDNYLALYQTDTSAAWANFLSAVSGCRSSNSCSLNSDMILRAGSASVAPFSLVTPGTTFTRTIQVENVPISGDGSTEVRIISKVSWTFHNSNYSVTITEHLTPWQ